LGHGQLTVPLVRGDSQGRRESYEQRAPVYTLGGNRGGYSATSSLEQRGSLNVIKKYNCDDEKRIWNYDELYGIIIYYNDLKWTI